MATSEEVEGRIRPLFDGAFLSISKWLNEKEGSKPGPEAFCTPRFRSEVLQDGRVVEVIAFVGTPKQCDQLLGASDESNSGTNKDSTN